MDNSNKNNKILKDILTQVVESFMEGYKKGKEFRERELKSNIITLTKEDSERIIDQMKSIEYQSLTNKIGNLETDIKSLKKQLNVLIENEKKTHEQTVTLITTVEEMLHALEESGIIPGNDLIQSNNSFNMNDDVISDKNMNDVMRTDKFLVNSVIVNGNKKFDLN